MRIGVPRETKENEGRVALTPFNAAYLRKQGQEVFVETGAGLNSGFRDEEYEEYGAVVVPTADDAWGCGLVVKVKEPLAHEYRYLYPGQIIFCYLHLAAFPPLVEALLQHRVTAIAYETIEEKNGFLPLLYPMSEIAGRMAVQIGVHFLEFTQGGKGILIGGVPGVTPGRVVIIGGGVVGGNAARIALGLQARVTVLDNNLNRLREIERQYLGAIETLYSTPENLKKAVREADLVIGAVLVPGARAPKLLSEEMVREIPPRSVIVDVAIDQGGCVATCPGPTTHDHPTIIKYDVIHYAVPNIPGAVPRTATFSLTNATLPFLAEIAGGLEAASQKETLVKGINTYGGCLTHPVVAESLARPYTPWEKACGGMG